MYLYRGGFSSVQKAIVQKSTGLRDIDKLSPRIISLKKNMYDSVCLLQRYVRLRDNGKFLDLEINCSDGSTRSVHKFVLNSLSVKLGRSLIALEESESFEAPAKVLDALIELAYTSKLTLTGGNMDTIGQLLRIASKYDINYLKQELSCHIKSTLSLSNALEFFKYASENGLCLKDIQLLRAYILKKNFMALNQQSNGFSNISQQDLESFIKDDNLGLKEEELFNLITEWVKNGYPERASLLNYVRYQNMNEDFKKNVVMEDVNMKNVRSPFKQQYLTNKRNVALDPRNPNEMVLVIGGWKASNPDGPCQNVEIGANYGVLTQPWKTMKASHKMPVKRAYHGIGHVDNIMYLFGGFFHHPNAHVDGNIEGYSRSTFAFDSIKKFWMEKAPMNERRCYVASATLMNKVYACGGYNTQTRLRSVEVYEPVLDIWGLLPNMTEVRSDAACVAFNNKIYVLGGFDGDQIHTSVEIFNPATNEWSFGPSLQVPRLNGKAIVYKDKIFVIGGDDGTRRLKTVEIYDPLVSPYFQLQAKQLMVRRSNFAVTVTDDKIFVMGGYDGKGVTAKTEMYDDKDKEWKATKSMKVARSALEALTLDHYTLNYKDFV